VAQFASDAFTGTSGTELHTYSANWTEHPSFTSGGLAISDVDRARANNGSGLVNCYYHTGAAASADYSVNADLFAKETSGGQQYAGVLGRTSTSASTFYMARYAGAGTNGWQLFKCVAGTYTQLGSTSSQALTDETSYNVKLEMVGTAIKLYKEGGGTATISVTDSSITAAGQSGLWLYAVTGSTDNASGLHFDNFSADDAGATTTDGAFSQAGAASVTVTGSATAGASASVSTAAALTGAGVVVVGSPVNLAGASALIAAGTAVFGAAVSGAAAGNLVATGAVTGEVHDILATAAASLTVSGAALAAAGLSETAVATLSAIGTGLCSAALVSPAVAAVTFTGAAAGQVNQGALAFASSSLFAAAAASVNRSDATLTAASALTFGASSSATGAMLFNATAAAVFSSTTAKAAPAVTRDGVRVQHNKYADEDAEIEMLIPELIQFMETRRAYH